MLQTQASEEMLSFDRAAFLLAVGKWACTRRTYAFITKADQVRLLNLPQQRPPQLCCTDYCRRTSAVPVECTRYSSGVVEGKTVQTSTCMWHSYSTKTHYLTIQRGHCSTYWTIYFESGQWNSNYSTRDQIYNHHVVIIGCVHCHTLPVMWITHSKCAHSNFVDFQ